MKVNNDWQFGQMDASEIDALRRTDDEVWVVWRHLPPNDPDVCEIAAVTGDGPTSEEHARLFAEYLNGCDSATNPVTTHQDAGAGDDR